MGKRRKSPVRHATRTIPFDGERLRLAIVADTHSKPHPESMRLIAERNPDAILHAGDIGALTVLDELGTIAPTVAVRGNIDSRAPDLPDSIALQLGSEPLFTLLLTHIAVYGPKLRADCAAKASKCGASMVVCGHSHVPFIGRDRGLTVFNPGSIGPRRFMLPITFGVLDISRDEMSLRHVS